jgi:hypothetical protein
MSRRGNQKKRAKQKLRHLKRQAEAKKAPAPALSRGLILDSPKGLIKIFAEKQQQRP